MKQLFVTFLTFSTIAQASTEIDRTQVISCFGANQSAQLQMRNEKEFSVKINDEGLNLKFELRRVASDRPDQVQFASIPKNGNGHTAIVKIPFWWVGRIFETVDKNDDVKGLWIKERVEFAYDNQQLYIQQCESWID